MLSLASNSLAAIRPKLAGRFVLRSLNAAFISLAAHLFLVMFVSEQIARTRALLREKNPVNFVMTVYLRDDPNSRLRPSEPVRVDLTSNAALPASPASVPVDEPNQSVPRPLVEVMMPPEPYYFPASSLDVKPRIVRDIAHDLTITVSDTAPLVAIFRLRINEEGGIDQVIVDASQFSEPDLASLVAAFSKMAFEPGRVDGLPVKSELRIEIAIEKDNPAKQ